MTGDRREPASLPWWMWPASQVGRVRSGLQAAAAADAVRLSELPAFVSTALLPAIAVLVPALVMVLHAGTVPYDQPIPDSFTLVIAEVFTESLPVMAAMLAIGLAAPAAGALAVAVYAVGDLGLTVTRGQLDPPLWALMARLASYWLLWALAVEIPLMGRIAAEWRIGGEAAPTARRWGAVAMGAVVVAALTWIWVQAAPLLVGVVFRLTTGWGGPTVAAMYPLQLDGNYLVAAAAVLGLLLMGLRYLGRQPNLARAMPEKPRSPARGIARHLITAGVVFLALFGVVTQPIDVLILLPALLLARPFAQIVLRATGAGGRLARLPMPIRGILGFVVALAVSWLVVTMLGYQSELSGFFTMVVALALSFVVMTVFVSADVGDRDATRTENAVAGGGGAITSLLLTFGLLAFLGLPGVVLADNGGDHIDGWPGPAAAAAAAAGAAAFAAWFWWEGSLVRRYFDIADRALTPTKMTREEFERETPLPPWLQEMPGPLGDEYRKRYYDDNYETYTYGNRRGPPPMGDSAADFQPPQRPKP